MSSDEKCSTRAENETTNFIQFESDLFVEMSSLSAGSACNLARLIGCIALSLKRMLQDYVLSFKVSFLRLKKVILLANNRSM